MKRHPHPNLPPSRGKGLARTANYISLPPCGGGLGRGDLSRKGKRNATDPLAISPSPLAGEGRGEGDTPAKGTMR